MPEPPRLYHFRISHYNEKVRWALDHKRVPHHRTSLVPGFHVPRARRLTGQNKTPILVFDGEPPLAGSTAILAEIERRWPDPPLYPADPDQRARADEIQRHFDDEVAPELRRLFWSTYLGRGGDCTRMATMGASWFARAWFRILLPLARPAFRRNMGMRAEQLAAARERVAGHFDRIEAELQPSGYLVGDRFGVADLSAAAVLSAIVRPPEFPYPLPQPYPPGLVELQERLADRPGYRWVLDIYSRHRGSSAEIAG